MQVVIPAAGEGCRFVNVGYETPKPFLPLLGKTMVEAVIDNVSAANDTVHVILRAEHASELEAHGVATHRDNVVIKLLSGRTAGAVNTILEVKKLLDSEKPLLVANCDQYVDYNRVDWLYTCHNSRVAIMTFNDKDAKWSYIKKDANGKAIQVADKDPISNEAIVGIYYFNRFGDFLSYAEKLIADPKNAYNGKFYIGGLLNLMVQDSIDITTYTVKMYGLGTPADYLINKLKVESL